MDDRRYLNLDELLIWSDNPRHGLLENEAEEFTEEEAINILIDVVGTDKMYNLIADIFASKKLMGNVNPVVVWENDKYHVYDGNRRVSALKILKNPDTVEDIPLRNKIFNLIKDEDVSFADRVFVYITDKEEALEIMDKTHSGEQQGVGMISWEPYQRDISLNRRGKPLKYPYAFNVSQALKYNIRSFNTIHYTDLDRIFGSKVLREHFSLSEHDTDYTTKAAYIVGMLVKYKEKKRFNSFSRHFNITDSDINNGPMIEFCEWVKEQEQKKKNFYFKSCPVELYVDEQFSFELLQLQVLDSRKNEIPYDVETLNIKYISPNGIETDSIDMTEQGVWQVHLEFNSENHSEQITIKALQSPKIDFDSKKLFGEGNTIDLRKLIIRATDGHGRDRKDEVIIKAIRNGDIIRDIFTADNPIGTYQIAYSFQDITGAPHSVTKEIRIVDKSNPLLAENRNAPLLSYNGTCTLINISEVVNKLVSEINELPFENNICVITTSLRSLLELSFDELFFRRKIIFTVKNDLEKCIEEFKTFLLSSELSRICSQYSSDFPSFNNEKNRVEQIDPKNLASYLNLAAHKSTAAIDTTKVAEIARKSIAPILVYTSVILK